MTGMPLSLHGFPLRKSVQEISVNGDEPSPEFHGFPLVLLIFLHQFQSPLLILAIGQGISNSFLNKVRGVAKQFFQLPQEEKQKEVLHEYSIKLKQLVDLLFKAMAKSLAFEENSFSDQFGDNPPHSDRSWITVLLQDEQVEGLQFVKDEKWITVPVIPHALVVNLGDQMLIMSNGIFKSPVHRVVTNTDKLRISVAMFNEVEPEKEIGPVEGLIDENR
ncbi:hypothetical protein CXB51_013576 [Gossypium anomalum]|uniref:Fe2OG dioxygenase domain-containing protein n=1 Tax=Gossypium anomalum TaxID=47600 RepID=A0A8J5ZB60_9ROSI|nr:hypothetical protein CXB51_013576 [Gossypium anomalum]